jgi:nitroimidazol reductase NimA-like FMN-containing flavoprotein (pyridoxamine 5'-phosphate oxidase superfamily)
LQVQNLPGFGPTVQGKGSATEPSGPPASVSGMSVRSTASARTRVHRIPELAAYDRPTIDAILDAALVAHLGFVDDGQPFVIPTLQARIDDTLYLHGSAASRPLKRAAAGIPVCVTVTLVDGIVLARSIFEHSIDYRSVVVLGTATPVEDPEEKLAALHAFSEQVLPGRWADSREPTDKELKATTIVSLPLTEASAKISSGPPEDAEADGHLDVWAGNLPFVVKALEPIPDPALRPGIPVPAYLTTYERQGMTTPPEYP